MGGLEATERIRATEASRGTTKPVPIIGLSGNARQVLEQCQLTPRLTLVCVIKQGTCRTWSIQRHDRLHG